MAASVQSKAETAEKTMIGWQGVRFTLPPDWNLTGFSMDRSNGYVKVDSPGSMFVQVKWTDPRFERPKSLGGLLYQKYRKLRHLPEPEPKKPELEPMLETFMKQTGKTAKKSKSKFDYKIKGEVSEVGGERVAQHFSWSGGGQGRGKIWYCKHCGRVVIAQVVGAPKDNIAAVASELFSSIRDHTDDGWNTWALYDLVTGIPDDFVLKSQKLMSGYLKLDFERNGGEKIVVERWGLANVTKKKFTLSEWLNQTCALYKYRVDESAATVQDHDAVHVKGRLKGIVDYLRALRDAALTLRPAVRYDAYGWECDATNKIYAIQAWHNARSEKLLEEVALRCECH